MAKAWLPVAQAEDTDQLGPRQPRRMATMPLPILVMDMGMKKGETRLGPLVSRRPAFSVKTSMPPMPEPRIMPARVMSRRLVVLESGILDRGQGRMHDVLDVARGAAHFLGVEVRRRRRSP